MASLAMGDLLCIKCCCDADKHLTLLHVLATSAVLASDAPPEEWAQLLGVDLVSPYPTNFILLAEPEFSKLTEMTDGLDFAFPSANKIGVLRDSAQLGSLLEVVQPNSSTADSCGSFASS
jgi:small ligand-binding sensory domain FIST